MKQKNIAWLTFLFCLIFTQHFSQKGNSSTDSIINLVNKSKDDTNKVKNIIKISRDFILLGQLDSAASWANIALNISKKIKYNKGQGFSLIKLAQSQAYKANYPVALDYFLQGLRIAAKIKDKKMESDCQGNIGVIYDYQGEFKKAISYYKSCIHAKEMLGDKTSIAALNGNIGAAMRALSFPDSALLYHAKALEFKGRENDPRNVGISQGQIGSVYLDMKLYKKADSIFEKAVNNLTAAKDERGLSLVLISYAEAKIKLNKTDEAFKWALKSYELAEKLKVLAQLESSTLMLSEIYAMRKQFDKAYFFAKKNKALKDTIFNLEKNKSIVSKQLNYDFEKKELADSLKYEKQRAIEHLQTEADKKENESKLLKQRMIAIGGIVAFVLAMIIVYILYKNNKEKQKTNEELSEKNILIETQKNEVTHQKHIVEEINKEIMDSINYAKRIQYTLLANEGFLNRNLPNHFVLFKPKDVVSGDFYWAAEKENKFYLAICDSTGHGVPGAFMSLLNIGFLSEAIKEKGMSAPNEILNYTRERLIETISKEGQQDGFDGILVCFDNNNREITYAAANNSPIVIDEDELTELETDKMPVGMGEKKESFRLFKIKNKPGSTLYFYTDGYADQFGGAKGKKFKYKQLEDKILEISNLPMLEQKEILDTAFLDWKGKLEQVDDVLLIGIKV